MVQVINNLQEENDVILTETPKNLDPEKKNITEEAYRDLEKVMMAAPITSNNPKVNQELMVSGLRNRNVPLAKFHMEKLSKQITKEIVLDLIIIIGKWLHPTEYQSDNFEPSAPPLAATEEERNDTWMIEPLNNLRELALQVVDNNGDFILKKKETDNLHYLDLLEILCRDTLVVSSELVCYSAIIRWYDAECQRNSLIQDNANPRTVLKELIYAVRYGLMAEKEFLKRNVDGNKGPDRMGILTDTESSDILEYIQQKQKKKKSYKELPHKMSRKRNENGQVQSKKWEKGIVNCLVCWSALFD